eukprot:evm.model.scf_128EXC.17 EVM.evm.TU.scf_128EXC.17   scf_128EXC:119470-124818(+)
MAKGSGARASSEKDASVKSFTDLGICREVAETAVLLGWKKPSKIQKEAIPHLLQDRDVIGLAQTGSGKTGAFALPILQSLIKNPQGFSLMKLKHLVLDEADKLLDMDFEQEIDQIVKVIPRERRTQLFSATMTNKVQKLQRACLTNAVKITVADKYSTVDTLKQQYMFIPAKYKDCYLTFILNELSGSKFMIFTRTCDGTRRIAVMLRNLGFAAVPVHGQMTQPKRLAALHKFKADERDILVCTDVASRGLDIPFVDVVLNYDMPQNPKDYVHRVGRTARAGRSGRAITMVTQYDVEVYQKIEHMIGLKMGEFQTRQEEVLILLERVSEAQRIALMQLKESEGKKKGKKRRDGMDDEAGAEQVMRTVLSKGSKKRLK